MTRRRRDGNEDPFSAWIRNNPRLDSIEQSLSIMDVDKLFHKFIVIDKASGYTLPRQHLLFVEKKTFCAVRPLAQKDTMSVIDQALQAAHQTVVKAKRGDVKVFWHGFHTLSLSQNSPDDSEKMWWDGKKISIETLEGIIRFEIDAHNLRPREDRSHHKAHPILPGMEYVVRA